MLTATPPAGLFRQLWRYCSGLRNEGRDCTQPLLAGFLKVNTTRSPAVVR